MGYQHVAPFLKHPTTTIEGKLFPIVLRPNVSRIDKLAEADLEDIREVFEKFITNQDNDTSIEFPGNIDIF